MVFKKPTDEYQWVFFMRLTQDECIMIEINSQTLNKGKNIYSTFFPFPFLKLYR
jgi:hypothetical protein